jgi:hypothetical protein
MNRNTDHLIKILNKNGADKEFWRDRMLSKRIFNMEQDLYFMLMDMKLYIGVHNEKMDHVKDIMDDLVSSTSFVISQSLLII